MAIKSVLLIIGLLCVAVSCSKKEDDSSGTGIAFPELRPPVEEVAGAGLTTSALDTDSFQSRFFGEGPTNILNILTSLDTRLAEISARAAESSDERACLSNTPVLMVLTIFGENVSMYFQCYDTLSDSGLLAFGKKDDVWYLFEKVGAVVTAATATLLENGKVSVNIYGGVGLSNGTDWSAMSYGGYHVKANNETNTLEMTAGGLGLGFCGSHLNSDGTNLYIIGSEDGPGCAAVDSTCVLNASLGTAGTCTALTEGTFTLTALGRLATTSYTSQAIAESEYPATPNLTLNGTSTDSIHFGPSTAADLAEGITAF